MRVNRKVIAMSEVVEDAAAETEWHGWSVV